MSKNPKPKRFTIWRYMLEFYPNATLFGEDLSWEDREGIGSAIYHGPASDLPRDIAEKVAEIHPRYESYYRDAMMPLYKYQGKQVGSGTEDPVLSIASMCPYPHLVIRRIFEDKDMYPAG